MIGKLSKAYFAIGAVTGPFWGIKQLKADPIYWQKVSNIVFEDERWATTSDSDEEQQKLADTANRLADMKCGVWMSVIGGLMWPAWAAIALCDWIDEINS